MAPASYGRHSIDVCVDVCVQISLSLISQLPCEGVTTIALTLQMRELWHIRNCLKITSTEAELRSV